MNVFQPRVSNLDPNGPPKYSMQVLVPKDEKGKEFLKKLRACYDAALKETFPKGAPQDVREFMGDDRLKPCVRDGDAKVNEDGSPAGGAYAGHWYFNCSNKREPLIVHSRDRNTKVTDDSEFMSGDYGYVRLSVYGYNNRSKGVGFGLNALMISRKGEPLGGGQEDAESAFGEIKHEDPVGFDDPIGDDDPLV